MEPIINLFGPSWRPKVLAWATVGSLYATKLASDGSIPPKYQNYAMYVAGFCMLLLGHNVRQNNVSSEAVAASKGLVTLPGQAGADAPLAPTPAPAPDAQPSPMTPEVRAWLEANSRSLPAWLAGGGKPTSPPQATPLGSTQP